MVSVRGPMYHVTSCWMCVICLQSKRQRILGFVMCILMGTFCFSLVRTYSWYVCNLSFQREDKHY